MSLVRALILGLILSPALATGVQAQPNSFDIARFTAPAGFKVEQRPNQVQFTLIDQQRGLWMQIAVYQSQDSLGSLPKDFASEWQQTVAMNFKPANTPAPAAAPAAPGVTALEAGANVRTAKGETYAHLFVFNLDGRALSLMVNASSRAAFDTMRPVLMQLVQSVQPLQQANAAAAPSPAPAAMARSSSNQAAGQTAKSSASPLAGIWVGLKSGASLERSMVTGTMQLQLGKMSLAWRTFLPDGTSFEGLPRHGLLGLDLAAERRDPHDGNFWGQWDLQGNKVVARNPSGRVQEFRLDGDKLVEDAKSTGSASYTRAKPVDGLRLDGTWSIWREWNDGKMAPNWKSAPVIAFSRDGRFVDRGAFMDNPTSALKPEYAEMHPGMGRYEIREFTLVLHYEDGRVVKRAFTGALKNDVFQDVSVVYVGQFPFYKL